MDPLVWAEQKQLVQALGLAGDHAGWSVFLDGNVAVVGAPDDDYQTLTNTGRADVYERNGSIWSSKGSVAPLSLAASDRFGAAVASSNAGASGLNVIVGAPGADANGKANHGKVFIYNSLTGQSELFTLTLGLDANAAFGSALDVTGGLLAVGAPGAVSWESPGDPAGGRVFVFAGLVYSPAALAPSDLGAGDKFGASVAVTPTTVVAGAPLALSTQGAAYVYTASAPPNTVWTQQAKLVASDGATGDRFGTVVAVDADTAFVGADWASVDGGAARGAVYVFARSGTSWSQVQKLVSTDALEGAHFGRAVAVQGNLALVSAARSVGLPDGQGAVYVFQRSGGAWSQVERIVASDGKQGDSFGLAVSLDAGMALVGARLWDGIPVVFPTANTKQDMGAAYVFGVGAATGDACTQDSECLWQHCVAQVCCPTSCDDANDCTLDSCATGSCTHTPAANGALCASGSGTCQAAACCTGCWNGTSCQSGSSATACGTQGGACASCSDGNACTQDSCSGGACTHPPVANGTSCADGNLCNGNETCQGGTCGAAGTLGCDDGNPCTDDTCSPTAGCQHTNNANVCSDGNACTTADKCSNGSCAGTPLACGDNNPCTNDSCDPVTGCKNANLANGTNCDDGNVCSSASACQNGACVGTVGLNCTDANPCTLDTCSGGSCAYSNQPSGTACSDSNACTESDVCTASGVCGGVPKNCDDGNPCTEDSCDPAIGCQHAFASADCSDGDPCTVEDTCTAGKCNGKPMTCPPEDECHLGGSCDSTTGDCNPGDEKPDGAACAEGSCQGGVCSAGGAGGASDAGTDAAGTGGLAGTAGESSGGSAGESNPDAGSNSPGSSDSEPPGCGCRVDRSSASGLQALLISLAGALGLRRRRRTSPRVSCWFSGVR